VIPPLPAVGTIVINELLADNGTINTDPNGQSEDWFELYNTTSSTVNLTGLYVSDDALDLTKWQIPVNTTIPANGYLGVWADNDLDQSGFHAAFKLSASGESLILSDGVNIFDQVTFTAQTTDVSYGRCPDGSTFDFAVPTFEATNNCTLGVDEAIIPLAISMYPVPSNGDVTIASTEQGAVEVVIFDMQGRMVYSTSIDNITTTVPSANWESGCYIARFSNEAGKNTVLRLVKE
jgi:hypothetical protein